MRSHILEQFSKRRIHQGAIHDHGWKVVVSRLATVLLLAAVALSFVAPAANAVPEKKLDDNLAAMWTTILQTPSAQNPFFTGGGVTTSAAARSHRSGSTAPTRAL